MPPDMPEPLGKEVEMRCFVDDDHSGKKLTSRPCSCFIIFLHMEPICYCSKRQNTVESNGRSSVGEFPFLKRPPSRKYRHFTRHTPRDTPMCLLLKVSTILCGR